MSAHARCDQLPAMAAVERHKACPGMIWPTVKRILRPAARVVRWFRREHVHALVVSRDGRSAFGMIGTSRWRPHFARICFGDQEHSRTEYRVHGSSWVRHAHVMAARHGLVV